MVGRWGMIRAVDVERWVAAVVPWWLTRIALVAAWIAAVAVSVRADEGLCTVAKPCTPDPTFAFALVLLLATPVLLAAGLAVTGCLAGAGFALLDLLFDDVFTANVAFGLHGAACAVVAVWILRSRTAQRHLAHSTPVVLHTDRSWGLSPALAALLAILGGWAFLSYDNAVADISKHVAAASRLDARVVEVQSVALALELPNRERVLVEPLSPEQYRVGDQVPVLADGQWVRLVAEPEDATFWLTLGFGAYFLVLLLVVRTWRRRSLWDGALPSIAVRLEPIGAQRLLLRSSQGAPMAVVRTSAEVPLPDPPYTDEDHFGRVWRGEEPEPEPPEFFEVTVAGELCYGGRVALLVDNSLLAIATLAPPRRPDDHSLPGSPVPVGRAAVELPCVVRSDVQRRTEGLLMAGVAVGCLIALWAGAWAVLTLLGVQCLVGAWYRLQPQMRLEHRVLVLNTGLFAYHVPWTALHGVRRERDRLVLAFGPFGDMISTPPVRDAGSLGEQLMWLRARALLADGRAAVVRRLGPVPLLAVAYLVLALVVLELR